MMKTMTYILSVHTENNMGLLNRISSIFLKRRINIKNLTITTSEIDNVAKFIFEVQITENQAKNVNSQIEKQIGVIRTSYHMGFEKANLRAVSNPVILRK